MKFGNSRSRLGQGLFEGLLVFGLVLSGLTSVGPAQAACDSTTPATDMLTIDAATGAVVVDGKQVDCTSPSGVPHASQVVASDPDPEESTVLISRDPAGQPFVATSAGFSLSSDGRYGVFHSLGEVGVPGQVYLWDQRTNTTELVSVNAAGEPGNLTSRDARISSTGRYIVFRSGADNLVPGDANNRSDIFLYDRNQDRMELISIASDGTQANGSFTLNPSVSANGRYVVFTSNSDTLVPDGTSEFSGVYLRDRAAGTTMLITRSLEGMPVSGTSPSISADGRYISYVSISAELVEDDTNEVFDAFVYDRVRETTERVSVASDGSQAEIPPGGSRLTAIDANLSPDGRYVVFSSAAANLVPNDTNGQTDVFIRDLRRQTTDRVSVAADGSEGNDASSYTTVSVGGRYVAFRSLASNLVANDTNGVSDIFVRDMVRETTERVSVATDGSQSNADSGPVTRAEDGFFFTLNEPGIDGSGRQVIFTSAASNLVANDTNDQNDVFVRTWR